MNIKSNKVLALSLVSLLSVAPAIQSMSYVNAAWDGIKAAPAKTWEVAKATPGYTWNGIKVAPAKTWEVAKATPGYTWNGIKVASDWSLDRSKAAGRHVWNRKKTYASATTAAVLAALACMYPNVVREYAKNAYEAVKGFDCTKRCNQIKDGASSLWKRVLRK